MEKSKNLILIQAFMLLCAFVLPFISVYCQEYRNPAPKRTLVRKRPVRRITPSPSAKAVIAKPTSTEEVMEQTENTGEETESTQITSDTKQTQAATQAPDTWTNMYRTFAIVLLNSLYKGSETGIGALTKIVIKRFVERRDILAERQELELEKKELESYKSTRDSLIKGDPTTENYVKTLSEEAQLNLYKKIKNIPKEKVNILVKEDKLTKLEKETSLTAIAATGVYMGLLNTAVPMMGTVMGTAVKLTLQMLMPAE